MKTLSVRKNEEGEIWKDIEGYERLYQVSNIGRVRSLDKTIQYVKNYESKELIATHHFKGRILKQGVNSGYLGVVLAKDGNVKDF